MFRASLSLTLVLALTGLARGQESLDQIDQAKAESSTAKTSVAEVNGYLDNRLQGSWINPNTSPVSTRDQPALQDILEANVQLKVHLGSSAFVYADLSLFFQYGTLYYQSDGMGGRQGVADHWVAGLQPFFSPNELYISYAPRPWLHFLAGRKRVVWGSGFAFNPTDLINPPKDPTDPNLQRAGAWQARIELPFERFTFSLLAAPSVLYSSYGLPSAMLAYPSAANLPPPASGQAMSYRDDQFHYLLAARLYALIWDSDINLMAFFSNQYNDGFANKLRLGASFSRYFFTDYELHAEALFQQGSARPFVNHWCVADGAGFGSPGCPDPAAAIGPSKLADSAITARVLVGGRTMFKDESTLSIEYYYQGDGDSDLEFEDTLRALVRAQQSHVALPFGPAAVQDPAVKFAFDPLRRHYLIASYMKPKIHDDWTLGATLIAGLRDLSGMFAPMVSWDAREWLTLTLNGFIPIRGIPVGQVSVNGNSYSEYSMLPFDWRVLFEARAFY